jgi:DUF4097 and DUF4098 domain-containing protein YvlB
MQRRTWVYPSVLLLLALTAGAARAASHEITLEKSIPTAGVHTLQFQNLAGTLTLGITAGDAIVVRAHVVAGGSSEADAAKLAARIALELEQTGDTASLTVSYPVDDYDDYLYHAPGLSGGSVHVRYMDTRVTVNGGFLMLSSGIPLHVDVDIRVPKGIKVHAENAVGAITADGLSAGLYAKVHDGSVTDSRSIGEDYLDTGSGDVHVSAHRGTVKADTGSGDAVFEDVTGDEVYADTGSGDVSMSHCKATLLYADTGSGDVKLDDVQGSLHLDTGSGGVDGTGVTSGEKLYADTGSGHVRLDGDLSAVQDMYVDTGSGDIMIKTSRAPSLHIEASSSSGNLTVDLPDMQNVSSHHHEFRADVNGGKGKAKLDAGSGDVSFTKD